MCLARIPRTVRLFSLSTFHNFGKNRSPVYFMFFLVRWSQLRHKPDSRLKAVAPRPRLPWLHGHPNNPLHPYHRNFYPYALSTRISDSSKLTSALITVYATAIFDLRYICSDSRSLLEKTSFVN